MIPHVLSIAGSDPSGGAGVQADLKTFSALGAYGMSAITTLTAQNTQGVHDIYQLPASFVRAQIEAVFDDIRVDAVKIGMVGSAEVIDVIVDIIQCHKLAHVVVDPVMVAQSGARLADKETVQAIKKNLLPMASVVTPNIPEAEALLGLTFKNDMKDFARRLLELDAPGVLLKGGHLKGDESTDIYADAEQIVVLSEKRLDTTNTHGTGCTLASALAVYLAKGLPAPEAAYAAKKYVTDALHYADDLSVGTGQGPLHHFYKWF